jgi:hypothetical protein
MIEYTDEISGKKAYVMVNRIVKITQARPPGRAASLISLDTGETIGAYEDAETIKNRVVEFQSWQTAIASKG